MKRTTTAKALNWSLLLVGSLLLGVIHQQGAEQAAHPRLTAANVASSSGRHPSAVVSSPKLGVFRSAAPTRTLSPPTQSQGVSSEPSLESPPSEKPRRKPFGFGHIVVGGPWVSFRSVTVVTDQNSVDGFFLAVSPNYWGRQLAASVTRNGSSSPYALSMNFHGATPGPLGRNWLGGCTGILLDEELAADIYADVVSCTVPSGAITVEVTSYSGADLDVVVEELKH